MHVCAIIIKRSSNETTLCIDNGNQSELTIWLTVLWCYRLSISDPCRWRVWQIIFWYKPIELKFIGIRNVNGQLVLLDAIIVIWQHGHGSFSRLIRDHEFKSRDIILWLITEIKSSFLTTWENVTWCWNTHGGNVRQKSEQFSGFFLFHNSLREYIIHLRNSKSYAF